MREDILHDKIQVCILCKSNVNILSIIIICIPVPVLTYLTNPKYVQQLGKW